MVTNMRRDFNTTATSMASEKANGANTEEKLMCFIQLEIYTAIRKFIDADQEELQTQFEVTSFYIKKFEDLIGDYYVGFAIRTLELIRNEPKADAKMQILITYSDSVMLPLLSGCCAD